MVKNKRKVLLALALNSASDGERCVHFSLLMRETKLDRREVRRHCRALAREGLAEYWRGLWTDGGEPAGAGYCITYTGMEKLGEPTAHMHCEKGMRCAVCDRELSWTETVTYWQKAEEVTCVGCLLPEKIRYGNV